MRGAFFATVCIALLVSSGASVADEYRADQYRADQYRADQFLGLDLSKAVLSPKPLGPATEFAPVAVEAKTDHATDHTTEHATDSATEAAQARAEPKAGPRIVIPKTRLAHVQSEKPRGAAHNRLARRHVNPLDAQAFDTRIQVWPCKSGGICSWKRSAE